MAKILKNLFSIISSSLHTNNLITKNQSGFRPGDSTTNHLLYLIDEIHQAFDCTESFEVIAVFLDISKAFDKVWHEGLVFKLAQNGISGSLLKLFQNYLNNRKQRIVLNGSFSEYSKIASGVPRALFLVLYYSVYTSIILKTILNRILIFLRMTLCFFL